MGEKPTEEGAVSSKLLPSSAIIPSMAVFDAKRTPSPKMVERALSDYGEDPNDLSYYRFAMLVSQGVPLFKAYKSIRPTVSDSSAEGQSCVLASHPKVREWIIEHAQGGPTLAQSVQPGVIRRMWKMAMDPEVSEQVRARLLNSLADRGGTPRSSEITITAQQQAAEAREGLARGTEHIIEAELIEDHPDQPRRALPPASTDDDTGASQLEQLAADRERWAEWAPELRGAEKT